VDSNYDIIASQIDSDEVQGIDEPEYCIGSRFLFRAICISLEWKPSASVVKMMSPELLAQLVDEHAAALVLFARQWCAAPEDIVQQAFLKLVAQGTPPVRPVPWLYRVVRNEAISAMRAAKRRQRHESLAAAQAPAWFVPTQTTGLDVEEATRALQTLQVEQREIIVAHLWGGLTFEQIGELTGTSASTSHRSYIAGLSALRERLGVSCPKNSMNRA
jgi:RNA polymerase sigma-70 factor (ECF subfamily)